MATTADPPGVAGLGLEQWQKASRTLAAAFYDDPVLSWLIPSDRRRLRALERFFGIETRHLVLAHGRSVGARTGGGSLVGVTLVLPGEHWRTPIKVQAAQGPQAMRVFAHRLPVALGVLANSSGIKAAGGLIALVAWAHYVLWGRLLSERTAGEREEAELLDRARAREDEDRRMYER